MTLETIRLRFEDVLAEHYTQEEIRQHFADLCEHYFGLQPAIVVLDLHKHINNENAAKLISALDKLRQHIPIQYIIGQVLFAQATIQVNKHVLIPRPETEQLVHYILENNPADKPLRVLDIGTGSGCIAIALKKARPNWQLSAWELDAHALSVAQQNSQRNNTDINFNQIDVLSTSLPDNIWDIIVANPPYVPNALKENTAAHVITQEPLAAIFVPDDTPLIFYESIVAYAQYCLASKGRLFFEGHDTLMKSLAKFLEQQGFCDIVQLNDFRGYPRFIDATKA